MVYMEYFCDGLTSEQMKRAEDELGETDEVKMKCLAKIKNLISDEEDFHPCMDDSFLLRFLRVKKFKTEKAFRFLKDYYVYKAQYSSILSDRLPSDIRHVFEHGESTILEHRNKDGAGVFVTRVGYYDIERFTSDGQIVFMLIATEVGLQVEATQITGYSVIIDFDNFSIEKARHFGTPRAIYRIIITILRSMPCRIKSYHIVNEARFVSGMLSVGMHLVSKKLKKRIHFHGKDLESLQKFLSPEILPEEYGGQQGPLNKYAKVFGERALSLEEHFKEMNKYGYKGKTLEKLRK